MKKKQPKAYSLEFREEALRQLQAGTKPIRHCGFVEPTTDAITPRAPERDTEVPGTTL